MSTYTWPRLDVALLFLTLYPSLCVKTTQGFAATHWHREPPTTRVEARRARQQRCGCLHSRLAQGSQGRHRRAARWPANADLEAKGDGTAFPVQVLLGPHQLPHGCRRGRWRGVPLRLGCCAQLWYALHLPRNIAMPPAHSSRSLLPPPPHPPQQSRPTLQELTCTSFEALTTCALLLHQFTMTWLRVAFCVGTYTTNKRNSCSSTEKPTRTHTRLPTAMSWARSLILWTLHAW